MSAIRQRMDEQQRQADVERLGDGDQDALQRLIVEYHRPLRIRLTAAVDQALHHRLDPDDVLQQAYISAVKAVADARFDSPGGFYKWLERIALNQLSDAQRKLRRHKRDVGREARLRVDPRTSYPGLVGHLTAPDTSPSRRLARDEAIAAVMSSLARLCDDQREVVRLRFLESYSVRQIAEKLDKSEAAVHMLCHRGLKALRAHIVALTRFLTRL